MITRKEVNKQLAENQERVENIISGWPDFASGG